MALAHHLNASTSSWRIVRLGYIRHGQCTDIDFQEIILLLAIFIRLVMAGKNTQCSCGPLRARATSMDAQATTPSPSPFFDAQIRH